MNVFDKSKATNEEARERKKVKIDRERERDGDRQIDRLHRSVDSGFNGK